MVRDADSSGGRPEGRMRVRWMKTEGPHLQSDLICAVPFSANTSQVKSLRQDRSVNSNSSVGLVAFDIITT